MKVLKSLLIISLVAFLQLGGVFAQGVVISDDAGASTIADESAVLDVQSTSKGMLIPRLTTVQRNAISNAKDGLLVFDVTEGSFYLFGQSKWTDLSTPAELWTVKNSKVSLTNTNYNLEVGSSVTASNMSIQADDNAAPDEPIFEIKDKTGKPILSVTSEGVMINTNTSSKGIAGGFAVGRYASAKAGMDTLLFSVKNDEGTHVYSYGKTSSVAGGFAVGRYDYAKSGMDTLLFSVKNDEGTHVYSYGKTSSVAGGFAVGRYDYAKSGMDTLLFSVKKDEGTRVYTSGAVSTAEAGGFAVGRYASAKGMGEQLFSINEKEGTHVYTNTSSKGVAGGFAVGKYDYMKSGMDTVLFTVNMDKGTNVYTFGAKSTSQAGGFAVGKYDYAKSGIDTLLFSVKNGEGTHVYTNSSSKGVANGFAVGRYSYAKAGVDMDETYFSVDSARTDVGYVGDGANTGFNVNQIGADGIGNVFNVRRNNFKFGYDVAFTKNKGVFHFSIGNYSSQNPTSRTLIHNYGDDVFFKSGITLGDNGAGGVSYSFPGGRGVNNQILKLDGSGNLTWQNDNAGSGSATTKNSSNLQAQLERLKKENAQLRKDIEEIKELLKK